MYNLCEKQQAVRAQAAKAFTAISCRTVLIKVKYQDFSESQTILDLIASNR